MKYRLLLITVIYLFFFACSPSGLDFTPPLSNQDSGFTITGQVISGNGEALTDLILNITGRQAKTINTDTEGRFELSGLPAGKYRISCRKDNFLFFNINFEPEFLITGDRNSLTIQGFSFAELGIGSEKDVLLINDIQGRHHLSRYQNLEVSNIPGIVTAVKSGVYGGIFNKKYFVQAYIQNPFPDSDFLTSEGLKLIFSKGLFLKPGDLVFLKKAFIEESRENVPNGSWYEENLSRTQARINIDDVMILAEGAALPLPILIDEAKLLPPHSIYSDNTVKADVEDPNSPFDPLSDGLDFYESLEHMLVQINDAIVVGGNNEHNEPCVIAAKGKKSSPRTIRQGMLIKEDYSDFNPEIISLADGFCSFPNLQVGDRFPGPLTGIMDYSYRRYKFYPLDDLPDFERTLQKEKTSLFPSQAGYTVACFNVENLAPTDAANGFKSKFSRTAEDIVNHLMCPDILALVEIQDDSGNANDSVVSSDQTLDELISYIDELPGHDTDYAYCYISPLDGKDGGEPGGNIRTAFLYNRKRVEFQPFMHQKYRELNTSELADLYQREAVHVFRNRDDIKLNLNPGLISPQNPHFENTRKSLAAEFIINHQKIFIVINHFNSKGGDQPLMGRFQPPERNSEEKRHKQAGIVADFCTQLLKEDPDANLIVLGDFNDFHFSRTTEISKAGLLINLVDQLPADDRYTYNYYGNSQTLDNFLISPGLVSKKPEIDIVHINSEFASRERSSDHDPIVCRFRMAAGKGDVQPPLWPAGFPRLSRTGCYKAEFELKNEERARIIYAGQSAGIYTPNLTELLQGKDRFYEIYPSYGIVNSDDNSSLILAEGLQPGIEYDFYFLAYDQFYNYQLNMPKITLQTRHLSNRPPAAEIFISEYIEGSGYNKAIELANFTGSTVNLAEYSLRRDNNGNNDFSEARVDFDSSMLLSAGDVFVICHSDEETDPVLIVQADLRERSLCSFNGNDQIALFKNDLEIDRIGISGDINFGKDRGFVRKDFIMTGQSIEENPRYSSHWTENFKDTFIYLGKHQYDPF